MEEFPKEFPYLSSIQSLKGETPSEKYRELHRIVSAIANNEEERVAFVRTDGVTERVKPSLLPLMRILVADRLKLGNFVIEALKSDDVSVIKRALSASWFFDPANLDVDFITKEIVPNASPRTRFRLIKVLNKSLKHNNGAPEKAEALFERLDGLYRVEWASALLPLLAVCSEQFIYRYVVKHKLRLSRDMLMQLYYSGRSRAVLKYLWLGMDRDPGNKLDRRAHTIDLSNYVQFLPVLVKRHLREFLELYEYVYRCTYSAPIKLGHKRAEFFLQNARETLIEKPKIFLPILRFKLVNRTLTEDQFKSMYVNLFPDEWNTAEYCFNPMIQYLEFYPQHMKMQMFVRAYEQKYNIQFSLDIFEVYQWKALRGLLTWSEKEEWARFKLQNVKDKQEYYNRVYLLPPFKSIVELKERIRLISDSNSRIKCIEDMIKSCNFYDSKEGLTKVLEYYEARHKNEQYEVLMETLRVVSKYFDFNKLEEAHWNLLLTLASRAHMKDEVNIVAGISIYRELFRSAVNFYLRKLNSGCARNEDEDAFAKWSDIILDLSLDKKSRWNPVTNVDEEFQRDHLIRLLKMIIEKYPEDHEVWDDCSKQHILYCLMNAMEDINADEPPPKKKTTRVKKHRRKRKRVIQVDGENEEFDDKNEAKLPKITVNDYPWLKKFLVTLISPNGLMVKFEKLQYLPTQFAKALKEIDLELYQSLIIEPEPTRNDSVETEKVDEELLKAQALSKRNLTEVSDKWKIYLDVCREKLSKGKKWPTNFVRSCKWYQDSPVKLVEQCLLDIEEPGSVPILGLLLDGMTFSKITNRYHPDDDLTKADLKAEDARKLHKFNRSLIHAMNYTNPPVALDTILPFCLGDYLSAVTSVVPGLAGRTPPSMTMDLVGQLMKKTINMKKMGVRLVSRISSTIEFELFFDNIHKTESNPGFREFAAKMIFRMFIKFPSLHTWEMMKNCIESLNKDEDSIFEIFMDVNAVDEEFKGLYIQNLLNKIVSTLDKNEEEVLVRRLMNLITEDFVNLIPEETLAFFVKRDFPKTEHFFIEIYALSSPDKFPTRSSLLMKLFTDSIQNLNEPDPKLTRYYPANFMIRKFLNRVFNVLVQNMAKNTTLPFVDVLLQNFSTIIEPYQYLPSYISLMILKGYMEKENLADFGRKLVQMSIKFITDFGTEFIISDIAGILSGFLNNVDRSPRTQLTITRAMVTEDERIGSFIGLQILVRDKVSTYGDEYDQLVHVWQNSKDMGVRANFHEFINNVREYRIDI